MGHSHWRRSASTIAGATALALGALTLASPGTAWAASLTGTLSPTTVQAHATTPFHVSLTSSGALIGQFVVQVPTAFTITSASNPQGGVLASATVNNSNNTVTVSGLANSNVSVDITTVDPTTPGGYTWSASAKDTLLGDLGSTNLPVVTVTPADASALAFVQGPSDVPAGTAMTPAVKVKAVDPYGNTVTSYAAPVALAYVSNPTGAAAPTGSTATPSSGLATFSALTFPTVGQGYTIRATSGSLSSPTSSPFAVGQSVVACIPDNATPCDSGVMSQDDTGLGVTTSARVVADPAGTADVLWAYVTLDSSQAPACAGGVGGTLVYNVTNRQTTATYTLTADGRASNNTVPPLNDGLCLESVIPFAGSQPVPGSPGHYYGRVAKCANPVVRPCQSGLKTQSNPLHSVSLTVLLPAGDPKLTS